ncbi:hypothetical protein BDP81DRAFT_427041 [Colletotrichum phormii]|uniref:Secreted protein n=1 Tax=Colletotrichum phormii TaxID=359342 RepID=A0AAI9ZS92_9PEZI|nr:uncharacterized protein BDP81DRAFT_427041 [Colletotrichum phormii]KAK1637257.1 hypothetical protein BDP81DRAFT_427041 [Colletotrichum phormii]
MLILLSPLLTRLAFQGALTRKRTSRGVPARPGNHASSGSTGRTSLQTPCYFFPIRLGSTWFRGVVLVLGARKRRRGSVSCTCVRRRPSPTRLGRGRNSRGSPRMTPFNCIS